MGFRNSWINHKVVMILRNNLNFIMILYIMNLKECLKKNRLKSNK
jgi:hypothetical protein